MSQVPDSLKTQSDTLFADIDQSASAKSVYRSAASTTEYDRELINRFFSSRKWPRKDNNTKLVSSVAQIRLMKGFMQWFLGVGKGSETDIGELLLGILCCWENKEGESYVYKWMDAHPQMSPDKGKNTEVYTPEVEVNISLDNINISNFKADESDDDIKAAYPTGTSTLPDQMASASVLPKKTETPDEFRDSLKKFWTYFMDLLDKGENSNRKKAMEICIWMTLVSLTVVIKTPESVNRFFMGDRYQENTKKLLGLTYVGEIPWINQFSLKNLYATVGKGSEGFLNILALELALYSSSDVPKEVKSILAGSPCIIKSSGSYQGQ